jgi:hypothetical protein
MSPAAWRRLPVAILILIACTTPPAGAETPAGRLVVRLTGQPPAGIVAPSITVNGPTGSQSTLIGALALAAGELRFDALRAGTYEVHLEGSSSGPIRAEVGVFAGSTAVLAADLERGTLRIDTLRPDPFGVDDAWDALWIEALPGAGEDAPRAASTAPSGRYATAIDGVGLASGGSRRDIRVGGEAMARASSVPLGLSSAASGGGSRRTLSMSDPAYASFEGATGMLGRSSFEGTIAHAFRSTAWQPQLLITTRSRDYLNAGGSVFQTSRLPHDGLEALELYTRVEAAPSTATRLSFLLYGEGSKRNYFIESYRHDPTHSPRQDRADLLATLRLDREVRQGVQVRAELGWQRSLVATGDGRYFDRLEKYDRSLFGNPGPDPTLGGLYWLGDNRSTLADEGHVYNSYRKNVQVDLNAKVEIWRNPGTVRTDGAGLSLRRGTYRSYEHFNPVQGSTTSVHAIGYDATGDRHSAAADREPGRPIELAGFGTARRPALGGEVEVGARLSVYRAGQRPLKDLSRPLRLVDGEEVGLDLAGAKTRVALDPRLGFTRAFAGSYRFWLTGGIETQALPSEAVFYSAAYLRQAAAAQDDANAGFAFGNPALRPERNASVLAALGRSLGRTLTLRGGATAERTTDAITPRRFYVPRGSAGAIDSLVYYVNGDARDRVGLFARVEWEPSQRVRARLSYDLSRARTRTVEPSVLDEGWLDEDLPGRRADLREGLPSIFPSSDDGASRGPYPSDFDRRHRVAAAITVRTPRDLIGETGRFLFTDFEITALAHGASGSPFSWTQIDEPSGSASLPQSIALEATGVTRNSGRLPWTGQLDLRVAKNLDIRRTRAQIWVEGTNLTDHRNVVRVYSATGEADDDAWLDYGGAESTAAAARLYQDRLKDPRHYGEPRLVRAGIRLALP